MFSYKLKESLVRKELPFYHMNKYEILFIFDPEANIEALKKKYETILLKSAGKIVEQTDWKKLTLAYPIKKTQEGYYLCLIAETDAANISEIRAKVNIDKKVLRLFIMNTDLIPHYVANTKLSQHEIVADHFVRKPYYSRFNRHQANRPTNPEGQTDKKATDATSKEKQPEPKPKQPPTIFYRPEKNPFYSHPKKPYSKKESFTQRKDGTRTTPNIVNKSIKKDAMKDNPENNKKEPVKSHHSAKKTVNKETNHDQ